MKQVKFPGGKKKEKQKYEAEPMIVLPSAPTESVTQYSIHLASSNADKTLDEMDMLRHITSHLNEVRNLVFSTFLFCFFSLDFDTIILNFMFSVAFTL